MPAIPCLIRIAKLGSWWHKQRGHTQAGAAGQFRNAFDDSEVPRFFHERSEPDANGLAPRRP
jgi:hypothetical protein